MKKVPSPFLYRTAARRAAWHLLVLVVSLGFNPAQAKIEAVFRFHQGQETSSIRPSDQKNSNSSYVLSQIYGTLLSYHANKLGGNLAEKCEYKTPVKIHCQLRKGLQWSDGSPLTASQFVSAFQEFLDPKTKALRPDLLSSLKNGKKIMSGQMKASSLGVTAKGDLQLDLELENPDSEWIYSLTSPVLTPLPPGGFRTREEASQMPSSGPYKIQSIAKDKTVMIPNSRFWKPNPHRPTIESLVVAEDTVALGLYEKGEMAFLRRLPTLFIPKFEKRQDFHEVQQMRFDYIGFNAKLQADHKTRHLIAESIPYEDLRQLFYAKPRPGCPGLPQRLTSSWPCLDFKKSEHPTAIATKYTYAFSKQGGEDHKRSAEWLQGQWLKNAGLHVDLDQVDNKIFVESLEKSAPDMFRKGIAPEHPTCLAAVKAFETGDEENYMKINSPAYDKIIKSLRNAKTDKEKMKFCGQALDFLVKDYWIIPTGPIFFTILAKTEWQGWDLNELNQLDLTDLQFLPR